MRLVVFDGRTCRLIRLFLLSCLLVLTAACAFPDRLLSPRANPPGFAEQVIEYETQYTYEGFALGQLRIAQLRRTPLVDGARVTRMRVTNAQGVGAAVSCLLHVTKRQVRRICAVEHQGTTAVITMAGSDTGPLNGDVYGPLELRLEGLSEGAYHFGTYTPALEVREDREVVGAIVSRGLWTRLRYRPGLDAARLRWLRLLALIVASHPDPRDAGAPSIDDNDGMDFDGEPMVTAHYDLRARSQQDDRVDPAYLASLDDFATHLESRGDEEAARQLRRLHMLERDQVFDEEAGAYNQRGAIRGLVWKIRGGTTWAANLDGRPAGLGINGGHIQLGGGLRLWERSSVEMGVGVQLPAFNLAGADKFGAPAGSYHSAAGTVDITMRHAFEPFVGGLEPVIGFSLATGAAFFSYTNPAGEVSADLDDNEDTVGGIHFGVGMEPIVGMQWAHPLNRVGSRFVAFVEVHPQVMFWPLRSASDSTGGVAAEAPAAVEFFESIGADPTWQVRCSLGVRLEL